VGGTERAIERLAGTAAKPIVRLSGCSSREQALALRGEPLLVPRETLPLEADEFWASDLAGCTVVDGVREVGVVNRMIALPSCEALEVTQPASPAGTGGSLLIPMVKDAIRSIDVAARRIDVDMRFVGE